MKTFEQNSIRKKKYFELLGEKMVVEAAPDPSDIIWENLAVTKRAQMKNKYSIFTFIFFVILGIFVLFAILKQISVVQMKNYPARTNCEEIDRIYTDEK